MNPLELIEQLTKVKSSEERVRLMTSHLLHEMPDNLRHILTCATIPHWFDRDILLSLVNLNRNEDFDKLFSRLTNLAVVQSLPNSFYCVEDTTRKTVLEDLWSKKNNEFRELSKSAAGYFSGNADPDSKIEWLYHLVVCDSDTGLEALRELSSQWNNNFRFSDLETLTNVLLEHILSDRVNNSIKSVIYYRQGRLALRSGAIDNALISLEKARRLSSKASKDYINIIQAIGDAQKSSGYTVKALESYHTCLSLSNTFNDSFIQLLTRANALESIGDIYLQTEEFDKALLNFQRALTLFHDIGDELGKANVFQAIAETLKNLENYSEALRNIEDALTIYQSLNAILGQASALYLKGNLQIDLGKEAAAVKNYKKACKILKAIGADNFSEEIQLSIKYIKDKRIKPKSKPHRISPGKTEYYHGFLKKDLPDVVVKPIISEKAVIHLEDNKYVFDVSRKATKSQIKAAIEYLFNVKVCKVNTYNLPAEERKVGKYRGFKAQNKRAIVTLSNNDSILLFPET